MALCASLLPIVSDKLLPSALFALTQSSNQRIQGELLGLIRQIYVDAGSIRVSPEAAAR